MSRRLWRGLGHAAAASVLLAGLVVAAQALVYDSGATFGDITVTGTVTSTKACAGASYVRVGPNYCRKTGSGVISSWTNATACTARTLGPALPADAKAVLLSLKWRALSAGAVAARQNAVTFYGDATCTTQVFQSTYRIHEFAAVTAGTVIGDVTVTVLVPLVSTNTIYTQQTNAGGNGNAEILAPTLGTEVVGYFD